MSARILLPLLLLPVAAQAGAEQVAQPRTGPEAGPLPQPNYANPSAVPPTAPAEVGTAAPAPVSPPAGGLVVNDVRVTSEGEGGLARPPRSWTPPQDPNSGFILQYRDGEALDANWARRQFVEHGLIPAGTSIERALALVQLINRAYLSAGFVNSGIIVAPDTPLNGGTLELRLIYGRLVAPSADAPAVTVTWSEGGSRGLTADYIRNRMPAVNDVPLSAIDIERDFRLLADNPAIRTVNADLRPGSRPGEASLNLTIAPQDPFDLFVSFANSRSPAVGGERVAVGGYLRNAITPGDIITGEVGVTEGLEDATLSYLTPFLTRRTFLSARGSYNNAAVTDAALLPLDISSRDRAFEVGLSHRLVEKPLTPTGTAGVWSPAQTFTIGAAVAYRRSKSFLLGEPFSFSPGSVNGRSKYTALRLTADYVLRNVDQVFAASLTITNGIDGSRSEIPGVPSPNEQFLAGLLQLNYARRLTDEGLELRLRASGQLSNSVLYSGERFTVGGEYTVRGYRENLLLTDEGVVGSVELAQPFSLTGGRRSADGLDYGAFTVSGFFDAAYVNNVDTLDPPKKDIYSVGASLAWNPSSAVQAKVSYGINLTDTNLAGSRDLQDRGVHFRLTIFPLRLFGI